MSAYHRTVQKPAESYQPPQNMRHSDSRVYETLLHTPNQQIARSGLTTSKVLQLQRQIGNQAVQRLLSTQTTAPKVQRQIEDIGNNQVTALLSDITSNGAGTFLLINDTKYWIDTFPSRNTYGPNEKITFTLETGKRNRAIVQNIREKINQGLEEVKQNQLDQQENKLYYENLIKDEPPRYNDFVFTNSAYKHCGDNQNDSVFVKDLSKKGVRDKVSDYVLDNIHKVIHVGPGNNNSQEFKIKLGGTESIVFTYNGEEAVVFHVGPSLA